jgi:hypothetical protein
VIRQYRVTYDSNEEMFIVHRHSHGMPNMEFRMHKSGLHYYDPRDVEFTLINTVSENKEGYTKRQIRDADNARTLYATLSYPSRTDFRWIIRSNQIKDCPVSVQDVDAAFKIWGKNVAALKGKITRRSSVSNHSNSAFDLGLVLVGAREVKDWAAWDGGDQSLEWRELFVCKDNGDAEAAMEIILIDLFNSLENFLILPVRQVVDCREANFPTQRDEERDLIHEEYIRGESNIFVHV